MIAFLNSIRITSSCVLVIVALGSTEAKAWVRYSCGSGVRQGFPAGEVTYNLLTGTYPGGLNYTIPFRDAVDGFNRIGDADVNIEVNERPGDTFVNLGTPASGSEVAFVDLDTFNGGNQSGFAAFSYGFISNCEMTQNDIVFDNDRTWEDERTTSTRYWNRNNFGIVSSHEIGHGQTLDHSNGFIARMNSRYPNSGPIGNQNDPSPYVDEIRAMRVVYPGTGGVADLVASRYKNFYGEVAQENTIKDGSTNNQVTALTKGDSYFADYTVENHGVTGAGNVTLSWRISDNFYISRYDEEIHSSTVSLPYGGSVSGTDYFEIPDSITNGSYYVGFIVDPLNFAGDSRGPNNGTALPSSLPDGRYAIGDSP